MIRILQLIYVSLLLGLTGVQNLHGVTWTFLPVRLSLLKPRSPVKRNDGLNGFEDF